MSRTLFGGDPSSYTLDSRGNVKAGATLTAWSAATGGTQYTDLLSPSGAALPGGVITSDQYGIIEFQGPDGITTVYLDTGSARRLKMTVAGGSGGDVAAHESDTTAVHGIADTSLLATTSQITAHEADTTNVHGIADTSVLATDAELAAHAADTTSVHGIADTSVLVTTTTGVLKSTVTTKGDLLAATGSSAITRVPPGTNGQVLTIDTTVGNNVKWATPSVSSAIPPTIIDAKGDLIAGTAADTAARLAVGATDGHVLKVKASEATGLEWGATPSDATKADVSGNLSQFADVSSTAPADQEVLLYDAGASTYVPTDISTLYAGLDANGQLAPANWPERFAETIVLNQGAAIPDGTPTGTIILRRSASASITPVFLGEDTSTSATTLTVVTQQAISPGEYLIVGYYGSGESGAPVTFTLGTSAGSFNALETGTPSGLQATTVQSAILVAECATTVALGSTITITVSNSRSGMGCTMAKAAGLVATTPVNAIGTIGYASANNIACTTSSATTVARTLGLFMVAYNPNDADERTISTSGGWSAVGPATHASWGVSPADRAGHFFWKELSTAAFQTGNAVVNEGGTGSSVTHSSIACLEAL